MSTKLAGEAPKAQLTIGVGTKEYVPNEQLGGTPHFSSDLYALGMTVIEVLTGLEPKALNRSREGELMWIDQAPDLNPALAAILSKMVRYDFRQRYQSVRAVLKDLEKLEQEASPAAVAVEPLETAISDTKQDFEPPPTQPIPELQADDETQVIPEN